MIETVAYSVFPISALFAILVSISFMILGVTSFVYGISILLSLVLQQNIEMFDVYIIQIAEYMLSAMVFIMISVGITRITFPTKILYLQSKIGGQLPFTELKTFKDIENRVIEILIVSMLLVIFSRITTINSSPTNMALVFAIIVISITVYSKFTREHKS
ncbi:hypothetical protein [Thermococcus sp. 5-4]|uniref:hypothetical protein n=1 Tax=Thermococcus sp. 5-4 TaxID=2008440 RepID=UPI0011AB5B3E|nr:hypothetical protein [Thermococcus sp. 5-4]